MAEATAEEKCILPVFRAQIEDLAELDDEDKTDKHLIRWLRARELHTEKAVEMIRKSCDWRREYRINSSLFDFQPPIYYKRDFPFAVTGYDEEGCPISDTFNIFYYIETSQS